MNKVLKIKNILLKNYLFSYLLIVPAFTISIVFFSLTATELEDGRYMMWDNILLTEGEFFSYMLIATFLITGLLLFIYAKLSSASFVKPINEIVDEMERFNQGDKNARISLENRNEFAVIMNTFNRMADEILKSEAKKNQLLEDKKQLMNDIVHDLKTPISSIKGFSDILKEDQLSYEEQRKYIDTINRNAVRLNSLVEDLHAYAKLDVDDAIGSFQNQDLMEWLRHFIIEYYDEITAKGFHLDLDLPDEAMPYDFDARLLGRCLSNLLANAMKYNESGTTLSIEVEKLEKDIKIVVSDDGVGIPLEYKHAIFEPFVRVDQSRNSTVSGFGLGLAFCKKAVEIHNGEIFLDEHHTKGAYFVILLPL